MDFEVINFSQKYLRPLFKAFQKAWDDPATRLNVSINDFEKRLLHKLNINPEYSLLAVKDEQIIGFILHTVNYYKGTSCIYNGGTGVIPEFRGNAITEALYLKLLPKLKEEKISKTILEVVTTNDPAIKAYRKIGFTKTQTYKCYANRQGVSHVTNNLRTVKKYDPLFSTFWDFEPCFLDQPDQLKYNMENEVILEENQGGETRGYIIFQPHLGRISQLAVKPAYRKKGIGTKLVNYAKYHSRTPLLTVMNIPNTATGMIAFLERIGFVNEIDQYEMELII